MEWGSTETRGHGVHAMHAKRDGPGLFTLHVRKAGSRLPALQLGMWPGGREGAVSVAGGRTGCLCCRHGACTHGWELRSQAPSNMHIQVDMCTCSQKMRPELGCQSGMCSWEMREKLGFPQGWETRKQPGCTHGGKGNILGCPCSGGEPEGGWGGTTAHNKYHGASGPQLPGSWKILSR